MNKIKLLLLLFCCLGQLSYAQNDSIAKNSSLPLIHDSYNQEEDQQTNTDEANNSSTTERKKSKGEERIAKDIKRFKMMAFFTVIGNKGRSFLAKIRRGKLIKKKYGFGVDALQDSTITRPLIDDIHIFAWHPHWMKNTIPNHQYRLLHTVSYFAYDIDPETGNYRTPDVIEDWRTTPMIDSAKSAGCNVLLSIVNHGGANTSLFLNNENNQQQVFLDSLLMLLEERQANGVDINFENIRKEDRDKFTAFVSMVTNAVKGQNPENIVTLDVPATYHSSLDIKALKKYVDWFVLMGYDYRTGRSNETGQEGSNSPLRPKNKPTTQANLNNSVNDYLEQGVDLSKFIVGFPYYGTVWQSENSSFPSDNTFFINKLTYTQIQNRWGGLHEPIYDNLNSSVHYKFKEGDLYTKCWFENDSTLGLKYDWVKKEKIGGVGIFALGYDNGQMELWNTLANKFLIRGEEKESLTFLGFIAKYIYYFIAAILFLTCFIFAAFGWASRQEFVRSALVSSPSFKLFFLVLSIGLLFSFFLLCDIMELQSLLIVTGLLLGLGLAWLGHAPYVFLGIIGFIVLVALFKQLGTLMLVLFFLLALGFLISKSSALWARKIKP